MPEDDVEQVRKAISELQAEIKMLQEAVGMLMGMVMEEEGPEEQVFGGHGDPNEPHFRFNVGM